MASLTVYPSGYDSTHSSYASVSPSYPITNGYDSADSTALARINAKTGSNAESVFYYTFDLSSLPSNATINSVSCEVKASLSGASYVTSSTICMCNGTTAKGTVSNLPTSSTAFTLSVGTWTAAELQNAAIRLYCKRGTSGTTSAVYFRFYGATLTVNYTEAPSNALYFKQSGSWVQATKAYKKVSGSWVEQADLTQVFDPTKNYVKG